MRPLFFGLPLLAAAHAAHAQGGPGVITLDMPPPGGEGLTALQTGGAFPTGATSLYYNPALLVELQGATGSQAHFSRSSWDLMPGNDFGMKQTFTAGAVFLPLAGGLDLGVGFFRNRSDLGESILSDSGTTTEDHETVHGLGLGVRVLGPFSVGVTAKHYESNIGTATAKGWALDAGALYYQPFQPFSAYGVRSLELVSSAGIAWVNNGKSVRYPGGEGSDPLPEALHYSTGASVDLADVVRGAWSWEWTQATHRRADSRDPIQLTYARHLSVLGFGLGWGRLVDPAGGRYETHRSREVAVDLLGYYRVFNRLRKMDWTGSSEVQEMGYPFPTLSVLGISYRFNPRFVIGERRVSNVEGARFGPYTPYFAFSL